MAHTRWDRVQELFEEALTRPDEDRAAYLRSACAGDSDLLAEVSSLLDADEKTDEMLDAPIRPLVDQTFGMRAPSLEAGTVLDQYEILDQVGAGGFGAVYQARHIVIQKAAAIKVLHPEHASSSMLAQRFINEARAVNEIGHPNIIDIFGFGQTSDGRLYFVMEYIDAPSLEEVLRREGALTLPDALPVLRGLAAALDAAHDRGIVHRDLKPANVVVRKDDNGTYVPKLLDFGIAKLVYGEQAPIERTESGQLMGTPAYMSPEQIRGKPVDGRADVYAFGVLAYRVLTGKLPFEASSTFDTLLKHTQEAPRPPSELAADLGQHVDAAILAMLAKDAGDRPASLVETVRELEDRQAPSRAEQPGASAWWRRALPLAAVVALVAAGWWSWARLGQEPTDPQASMPVHQVVAAPEPAAPASPDPAPAPDVPPATIELTVQGVPPGTKVYGPARELFGDAPGIVSIPASTDSIELSLEHPEHERESRTVVPNHDQVLEVAWPRKSVRKAKRRLNRDLESPFPK